MIRRFLVLLFGLILLSVSSYLVYADTPLNFVNSVFFGANDMATNDFTAAEFSSTLSTTVVTGNMQSKQMFVLPQFQGVNLPSQHQNLTRRGRMEGFVGLLDSKWNVFTHVYKVFSTNSMNSFIKIAGLQIDAPSASSLDLYIMGTLQYGTSVTAYFTPTQSISINCAEATTTFVAKISDAKNNWFLDPINNDPIALLDWILVTESTAGLSRVYPTGLLLKPDTKASVVAYLNFFTSFNTTTTYFDRPGGQIVTQKGMVSAQTSDMESAMFRLSSATGNMEALAVLLGNGYDQTINFVSSKSAASLFTSVFSFSANISIVQFSPATFVEISRDVLNVEEMYSYAFLLEMDWSFRLLWNKSFRQYLPDVLHGGKIDASDDYIILPLSYTAHVQPLVIEGNTLPYMGDQDAAIVLFDANTKNVVNVKAIGSPASDGIRQARLMTTSPTQGKLFVVGSTSGTLDFGNNLIVSCNTPVPAAFLLVLDTSLNGLNVTAADSSSFAHITQISQYEVLVLGTTGDSQINFQPNVKGSFLAFYGIYPTVYQARRYDSQLQVYWNSLMVDGTSISQFELTHSADPVETSRQTPTVTTSGNLAIPNYPSNGVYYIRLRPISSLTVNTPFSAPIPVYTCPNNYEGSICQFPKCYSIAADLTNTCNSIGVCYAVNTCYCGSRFTGQQCGSFKEDPVFIPSVFNNTLHVQTDTSGILIQSVEIPILAFSNETRSLISEAIITLDNQTIVVNQTSGSGDLGIAVNTFDMNVEKWDGVNFNRATFEVKAPNADNIVGVIVGNGFQMKTASSVLNANLCIIKTLGSTSQYTVPAFAKLDSSSSGTYRHASSIKVTEDKTTGRTRYCARISSNEMFFPALVSAPVGPSVPFSSALPISYCLMILLLCWSIVF